MLLLIFAAVVSVVMIVFFIGMAMSQNVVWWKVLALWSWAIILMLVFNRGASD